MLTLYSSIEVQWKDIKEAVNCAWEEVVGRRKPEEGRAFGSDIPEDKNTITLHALLSNSFNMYILMF